MRKLVVSLMFALLGEGFAVSINTYGVHGLGWVAAGVVLGVLLLSFGDFIALMGGLMSACLIGGVALANLTWGFSPFATAMFGLLGLAIPVAAFLGLVYSLESGWIAYLYSSYRLRRRAGYAMVVAAFGLLGLAAGYAINGSYSDAAGLLVGGLMLGAAMASSEIGWEITGWLLSWMVAAIAIADRLLHLGAWGVLFAIGGLVTAGVVGFGLIVSAFPDYDEEIENRKSPPKQSGKRSSMLIWFGGFALVFASTAKITLELSNLVTAIAAVAGLLAGGLALRLLGAQDRREEKEYYNQDDLDGTYLWPNRHDVPEAGSALPTP
jgi:hypothetical protein